MSEPTANPAFRSRFTPAAVAGAVVPAAVVFVALVAGGLSYVLESRPEGRVTPGLVAGLVIGGLLFPIIRRGFFAGLASGVFGTSAWLLAWLSWSHVDPFLKDSLTPGSVNLCQSLYALFLFSISAPVGVGAATALWAIDHAVRRKGRS